MASREGFEDPGNCASAEFSHRLDSLCVYTTVRYLLVQFNASQKPFVAFGNVPVAEFQIAEMPA